MRTGIETRLYTIDEVARMTRLTKGWIYRLTKRGEIRTVRIGRTVRVPPGEVARLLGLDEVGQVAG